MRGNVFSLAQITTDWMRFKVTQMADLKLLTALKGALAAERT